MYLYRIYVSRYPLSLACRYMIGESKSLFLVLGSHCAVFHRHRTGCMPGVQRCISCLLCVLVCSLMSALVLSRARSKFFQHSNPTGCCRASSKKQQNYLCHQCWNISVQEWAGRCSGRQLDHRCLLWSRRFTVCVFITALPLLNLELAIVLSANKHT